MDSPGPISPGLSTPSTGSPPPEEIIYQPSGESDKGFLGSLTSQLTSFAGGGSSSKRQRIGGSSYAATSGARDPRSRRRENSGRADTGHWDGKGPGGKRDKDELLDQALVDYLRKGENRSLPDLADSYFLPHS
jgi:hypothetical protein